MSKKVREIVIKEGAPAYMVSFGDMMTLILCFFVLLVSMAKERNYGLLAKGLGSFVINIRSLGLSGMMDEEERQSIYEDVRRRFNLPPEPDPERRTEPEMSSSLELVRAEALEALKPRRELRMPEVAKFSEQEIRLSDAGRAYLDAQADSLRPGPNSILLLEGHAPPSEDTAADPAWIAYQRAEAVRKYLIDELRFHPDRVEARSWLVEVGEDPRMQNVVHARLVLTPAGN